MSDILAKWEGTLKKKSTKKLYLASVKHFLTCAYGGDFKKPDSEYESLAENFLAECKNGRNWFDDLIAYAISLKAARQKHQRLMHMQQRNLLKMNWTSNLPRNNQKNSMMHSQWGIEHARKMAS